jgi:hypothetical protein
MRLHVHDLTAEQLEVASADLGKLIRDTKDDHPEAALVLGDALQLCALEALVRVVGDRQVATRLFERKAQH